MSSSFLSVRGQKAHIPARSPVNSSPCRAASIAHLISSCMCYPYFSIPCTILLSLFRPSLFYHSSFFPSKFPLPFLFPILNCHSSSSLFLHFFLPPFLVLPLLFSFSYLPSSSASPLPPSFASPPTLFLHSPFRSSPSLSLFLLFPSTPPLHPFFVLALLLSFSPYSFPSPFPFSSFSTFPFFNFRSFLFFLLSLTTLVSNISPFLRRRQKIPLGYGILFPKHVVAFSVFRTSLKYVRIPDVYVFSYLLCECVL